MICVYVYMFFLCVCVLGYVILVVAVELSVYSRYSPTSLPLTLLPLPYQDLAVWHQALVLPQMIATPIGGVVLDAFANQTCLSSSGCSVALNGYILLFSLTALYFVLGSLFVLRIRGIK